MSVLEGLKVVEFAGIGAGPFGGMLLADMGAEVTVIDRPDGPGLKPLPQFDVPNRGKRSIVIDLKLDAGRDLALRLVEGADALIEGFRPGVMERLGLGPKECRDRNPGLIYGRMTGWGQDGPLASRAGHDINYIALGGVLGAIGTSDRPVPPLNLIGDYAGGGALLALGVVSALWARNRTGEGQVIDVAMAEGANLMAAPLFGMLAAGVWSERREANLLDGGAPFYSVYRTADSRHVAVGALEPQFFAVLLETLGIDAAEYDQYDPSCWPAMRDALSLAFETGTQDEWTELFSDLDGCVTPVAFWSEAGEHPHFQERGSFVELDTVTQPGPAPKFSASPPKPLSPPPQPGQHTDQVLETLGISRSEISKLRRAGVVL